MTLRLICADTKKNRPTTTGTRGKPWMLGRCNRRFCVAAGLRHDATSSVRPRALSVDAKGAELVGCKEAFNHEVPLNSCLPVINFESWGALHSARAQIPILVLPSTTIARPAKT